VIGAGRLQQALRDSEDSVKLNTSFVERLNLTIRQGSAYLGRRTICQARWKQCLDDHLELLRCHYNFVRPHRALKFGREVRTPARQDQQGPDVERNFLIEGAFSGVEECPIRASKRPRRSVSLCGECVWWPSNN
jgi:hypothetical protein